MTKEKAIEVLENAKDFNFMGRPTVCEAIDVAIESLASDLKEEEE